MSAAADVNDFDEVPLEAYADDVSVKAKGAANDSAQDKPDSYPYPVRRLDELPMTVRPAVVQGTGLDEGAVAAIVGAPNAGKTAFAVSLALHVAARAERWLNLKVKGGPVVYFAAEAPGSVIMRARAAVMRQGLSKPALYIVGAAPGMGGMDTSVGDTARIVASIESVVAVEGEPVKMVFIDTLASCLGDGDENSDGMIRLTNAAKLVAQQTGACVVLVHHPSKGDPTGMRGHGSLAAACDCVMSIAVEELTGVRIATLLKARDHATGLQIRFELEQVMLEERDDFGDVRTTVVVKGTTQAAPRKRPGGKVQEQLLIELERRHRTGEQFWDKAGICKAGRDLGMHRNSALTALEGLLRGGFVAGNDARLTLTAPPSCT